MSIGEHPFTHERCICGWKRKITPTTTFICPECGKQTYRLRQVLPAIGQDIKKTGATAPHASSKGKSQKVFTLPEKLVGRTDPSPAFLGIAEETKESTNESN